MPGTSALVKQGRSSLQTVPRVASASAEGLQTIRDPRLAAFWKKVVSPPSEYPADAPPGQWMERIPPPERRDEASRAHAAHDPAGQWMHCVTLLRQRLMASDFICRTVAKVLRDEGMIDGAMQGPT